jgi:hypothetical protein
MNCSKGSTASLKTFLSKNSFQLLEKILERKSVQRQSILIWAVWHFTTSLTTWTTTSTLIFFNKKVLKCRQQLFILHFMLLPSCCKFPVLQARDHLHHVTSQASATLFNDPANKREGRFRTNSRNMHTHNIFSKDR